MTGPGKFWDDLNEDLKDPVFRDAYIAASQEIALCLCGHTHGQHADPDACFAIDNGTGCGCGGFTTADRPGDGTPCNEKAAAERKGRPA